MCVFAMRIGLAVMLSLLGLCLLDLGILSFDLALLVESTADFFFLKLSMSVSMSLHFGLDVLLRL